MAKKAVAMATQDPAEVAKKQAKAKKAIEARVVRAMASIDSVGKLANYKLTAAQIEAIHTALTKQVELTHQKLNGKVAVAAFVLPVA